MTSVDCLLLNDSNDFRLLDYTISCISHYDSLLNESNITDDVVLSYANDIIANEGIHLLISHFRTRSLTYLFHLSLSCRACASTSYNYQVLRGSDTIERL